MNQIAQRIEKQVKKCPDKIALALGDEIRSYAQLWEEGKQLALSLLSETDGKQGVRVGILLDQGIRYTTALLGVLCAEDIMIPLNIHATKEQLNTIFKEVGIEVLITSQRFEELCCAAGYQQVMLVWERMKGERKASNEDLSKHVADETAECNYLLTSGTTGHSKVVVLTTQIEMYRIQKELDTFLLTENDRILIATPLYHCVGQRMIMSALCTGAQIVFLRGYTPRNWIETVENYRITYTISVPTQLEQICRELEDNGLEKDVSKFESLRILATTSAYLHEHTKKRLKQYFTAALYNIYGSSETEWIAIADLRKETTKQNSLGQAVLGNEICIVSENQLLGNGQVGEILCKSPAQMKQYLHGDVSRLWNGFYRTGDLGYLNENKELYYVGRCSDMIICGGVNIYLTDIEQTILNFEGVKDCKAYGIHSNLFGELVGVDVELFEKYTLTENEIRVQCSRCLHGFQVPRRIRIVSEINRNAMGKYQHTQE